MGRGGVRESGTEAADHGVITEARTGWVRGAVELLVGAIGRADRRERAAGHPGLARVPVDELYRGAVTVLMRLVVLYLAEQRGLLPRVAEHGSAWARLGELCTALHERIGRPGSPRPISLFDPTAHPWLASLPIHDATVRQVQDAVREGLGGEPGEATGRPPSGERRCAVEQVGQAYECLLAYEARRADVVVVGLIGRPGRELNVPLAELSEQAGRSLDPATRAAALAARYRSVGIGSAAALAIRLAPLGPAERDEARAALLVSTDGDRVLAERLLPFARLVRPDLAGRPMVTLPGGAYLTGSALRRTTGAHYTPSALAADVVRHALQPLLYRVGPLETADRGRWEPKSSTEILGLRVADIALGAGAFLVAAARYLTSALHDAWMREGSAVPTHELAVEARRQVIDRCLYGVDINPMAVELARLSLWLLAMDPARPCSALDGRLVTGDSLLGITDPNHPACPPAGSEPDRRRALLIADLVVGADLAGGLRRSRPSASAGVLPAVPAVHPGPAEAGVRRGRRAALARECATLVRSILAGADPAEATRRGRQWLATDQVPGGFERRPVHWPLVFPEVFARGGFDAVIGNPPFLGGQKLTGALGRAYRELLVHTVGRGRRGSADLVGYFVLRADQLLGPGGQTGLIATNTLAQGDTRDVGLDQLVDSGVTIRRAVRSEPWPVPGAALEYCAVWTSRAPVAAGAERRLGGRSVAAITSALVAAERAGAGPRRLPGNARRCFIGSYVLGLGFTMPPERAEALLAADPRNADVLFPYLTGQDLNTDPAVAASRWVINFNDWPEDRARGYPACYRQVRELVKPVRDRNNRAVYRRYWWHYAEKRPAMLAAIAGLERVIVIALVSRTALPVLVPAGQVLSHKLGVFASDDPALLALLSSAAHYWWTVFRSSTIKADVNYSPSDVFETLPLPDLTPELRALGTRLDEYRCNVMWARRTGLTATYNLVFDPAVRDGDVLELRRLHREIDAATLRAYGWHDPLDRLDHGFHPVGRGLRYTVGPAAQREILDRLLALNHERPAADLAGKGGLI